jgi:hypothetical protein
VATHHKQQTNLRSHHSNRNIPDDWINKCEVLVGSGREY